MWSRIDHDVFDEIVACLPKSQRAYAPGVLMQIIKRTRREAGFFDGVDLQPGQCFVGTSEIADAAYISRQNVRTLLKNLEKCSKINQQTNQRGTVITLIDFNNLLIDFKNSNQQTNQQLTSNQPAPNQQLTTNTVVTVATEETIDTTTPAQTPTDSDPTSDNGSGCFVKVLELAKQINDHCGGTGIPIGNQRTQLAALIDKWGVPRLFDVAKEYAPSMDNKNWGYRIAVLRSNAEPKAPNPSCPICGHRSNGCKKLRTLGNYRNYTKIANPSTQIQKFVGVPHFHCPVCSHRAKALPDEHAKLKKEKDEKGNGRSKNGTAKILSIGAEIKRLVEQNAPTRTSGTSRAV